MHLNVPAPQTDRRPLRRVVRRPFCRCEAEIDPLAGSSAPLREPHNARFGRFRWRQGEPEQHFVWTDSETRNVPGVTWFMKHFLRFLSLRDDNYDAVMAAWYIQVHATPKILRAFRCSLRPLFVNPPVNKKTFLCTSFQVSVMAANSMRRKT